MATALAGVKGGPAFVNSFDLCVDWVGRSVEGAVRHETPTLLSSLSIDNSADGVAALLLDAPCHDGDDIHSAAVVDKGMVMPLDTVNCTVAECGPRSGDVPVLGGLVGHDYKVTGTMVCGVRELAKWYPHESGTDR